MKYTIQCYTELGNFANPHDGMDGIFCGTLAQCKDEFQAWIDIHERYYDTVNLCNGVLSGNLYKGTLDDTADVYPDFQLVCGKRGGIKKILA